jgi:hypothetical protein
MLLWFQIQERVVCVSVTCTEKEKKTVLLKVGLDSSRVCFPLCHSRIKFTAGEKNKI